MAGKSKTKRSVLILGCLDTKSDEFIYLRDRILEKDLNTIIVDYGVLGEPRGIEPEFTNFQTAEAAGTTLQEVRKSPSRGDAVNLMVKGAKVVVERLFQEGRIHGAVSMGGAGGALAATVMQVLPPGFPKLIVSPLASGIRPFGPFVGIRDITVMHSLVDIAGVNDISRKIFDNAANAICGMVKNYEPITLSPEKRRVGLTALGTVQKAIDVIFPRLKEAGYEPIIFHATGIGGQVMEDLIQKGYFCAVLDLATNELTDFTVGPPAFHNAGPNRLEAAGRQGIPQLIVPGCVDFFAQGAPDTIPEKWRARKKYYHNPAFTLIRPSHEEQKKIAELFCKKLNAAKGPVRVVLPLEGVSIGGKKGGSTYDPEGDRIFFETLKGGLRKDIPVIEEHMHVNQPEFAVRAVEEFLKVVEDGGRKNT
jgi:uncharacterized protein (UPF0261 family)